MKQLLREYFLLSRKERNGLLILVGILLLLLVVPEILFKYTEPEQIYFDEQLSHIKKGQSNKSFTTEASEIFFDFDPNTASYADLSLLGLSEKSIAHIENYRKKGGVFYSRDDLLKINDISKEDYLRIRKYIKITKNYNKSYTSKSEERSSLKVDINKADSAALTRLKGIGPVFASRIIKYRNSRNGFTKIDQLKEVYGLNEELVEQLRPFLILTPVDQHLNLTAGVSLVSKEKILININTADTLELIKLKGIGPAYSRRIYKYRNLLGGFTHLDQLKEVYGLPEETIELIKQDIYLEPIDLNKININKSTFIELTSHPYINKNLADYIIKYRAKKVFTSVAEIKESFLVDDDLYRKLAPYLEI